MKDRRNVSGNQGLQRHCIHFYARRVCLLASKIKDDQIKIRDVINVTYHLLNRNALDLGEEYFSIRDAIVQAELLIARTLKFDLCFEQPHKVKIGI
ncbi:hypothetical protein GQX74_013635 [Glossina fuscipes]|nr:hypothetical protein GQX74_013635 [Glossina fuscipes]